MYYTSELRYEKDNGFYIELPTPVKSAALVFYEELNGVNDLKLRFNHRSFFSFGYNRLKSYLTGVNLTVFCLTGAHFTGASTPKGFIYVL
jgi:hypothetical protein